MSSPDPSAPPTDASLDAPIAHAERRLAMLERLAEIGMALAEEIGARNVNAPYHPEPRHDPARSFAAVSRAVRLTLALEVRIEAALVALRNGETPSVPAVPGGPGRTRRRARGAGQRCLPRPARALPRKSRRPRGFRRHRLPRAFLPPLHGEGRDEA